MPPPPDTECWHPIVTWKSNDREVVAPSSADSSRKLLQPNGRRPLKGKEDWQGKEVNDYWAAVGKKLMTERLYSK